MAALTSAAITPIALELLIVLLVVRRSYWMAKGVRFTLGRLVVLPALLLVLWAFTALESVLLTPWALPYLIALDTAVVVVTTLLFAGVAERATELYRGPSGEWYYRIGFAIAALFLVVYLVRLALTLLLFPQALDIGVTPPGYPPESQQVVLAVIDALFSMSVGLLIARSIGIYRHWRVARSAPA